MENPRVRYVNLAAQCGDIRENMLAAVAQIFDGGEFILGATVERFEARFAAYCDCRHALGVGNGTDAIILSLKALGIGPGDEVITVANSFLATAAAVALVGARPVFVDVRDDYNINPDLIEAAITARTKAILPVHLTGKPADMDPILAIARRHHLHVVEDAAQAVGATYRGRKTGSFGVLGCFSLHPLKNLNACGDAGIITTNDEGLYQQLKKLRNHGLRNRDESEFWGFNSRLDSLQAALLLLKFDHLEAWTEARRATAAFYRERLSDVVRCPDDLPGERAVYHTFVIQAEERGALQRFMLEQGVETKVHYPVPIHLQPAARSLGYQRGDLAVTERLTKTILSLPVYPELTAEQKLLVVQTIRTFYKK
ncbi:MAG: DegT/DnrJ/EryC1/StrS family aminotransferase [Verrucomicrobiia bacterium]